ncbi:MAG: cytochrome c55X [Betaproteobacteria bacterium]|nr:cytochrome c55X [Betaproteobacteria bacterium]
MLKAILWLGAAGLLTPLAAWSDAPDTFPPDQIKRGAATFAEYCTPCHGERMSNPELFNLKKFPPDQRARFINSVSNGKNAMPPWRGQLKPDDIEALWSYVSTGEKD